MIRVSREPGMIREWLGISRAVSSEALWWGGRATAVLRPASAWSLVKFAHRRGPVLLCPCTR